MATIEIEMSFEKGSETRDVCEEFDVENGMECTIDGRCDEIIDELNADVDNDDEDDWAFVKHTVACSDGDFPEPHEFSNLDDYADYVELAEELGEAFQLRWDDIGEITQQDFEDSYRGCWDDTIKFAQSEIDAYGYTIPPLIECNIDWEGVANDLMMDHSEYEGDDGIHIFVDC
jgi:antirestriction protein